MKQYANGYIEKAITRESKISYDIPHWDRMDAKGAWAFSRTTGAPFNVHLSFSFEVDVNRKAHSIRRVRKVAHKIRMWYRTKSIESNILWTRFVTKLGSIEYVDILVHIPDKELENFKRVVNGWDFNIAVEPASYLDDRYFSGRSCSIFDIMLRAVSNETLHKQPDVPAEMSEAMVGPRLFYSVKLWIKQRRSHRASNAQVSVDATYSY